MSIDQGLYARLLLLYLSVHQVERSIVQFSLRFLVDLSALWLPEAISDAVPASPSAPSAIAVNPPLPLEILTGVSGPPPRFACFEVRLRLVCLEVFF